MSRSLPTDARLPDAAALPANRGLRPHHPVRLLGELHHAARCADRHPVRDSGPAHHVDRRRDLGRRGRARVHCHARGGCLAADARGHADGVAGWQRAGVRRGATCRRNANALPYVAVVSVAMAGLQRLRRSQAELAKLVIQDQLTNVLNARAFADRLAQELDRNRRYPHPLSLLYMDLDNFKVINDTHGHQTGDAVLRLVADAMRGSVRQADVVGRLGADEFAVLLPETDAQLADAAAKRLVAGLRNVFKGTPSVTASIGVVSCSATDASTDDLLRRADQAMYDAKRMGKDRVVQVAL